MQPASPTAIASPISSRLNLDFSIGIGYMWGKYMKQHLVDTHDVWQSTHNRSWFGPTKAEIGSVVAYR